MIYRVWSPTGTCFAAALFLMAVQAGERWRRGVWGSRSQSILVTMALRAWVLTGSGGSWKRL